MTTPSWRARPIRSLVPLLCLALAGLGLAVPRPAAAADIPRPHDDPFYTYAGSTPLAQQRPGAVLDQRAITAQVAATIPISATQLLYRTVDEQGRPASTVTTVIAPLGTAVTGVVSYLSFYDALGDKCSPSYTLRGGDPGEENRSLAQEESALIALLVAQGYAVTVPDFEGTTMHWVAGHESGWSALDSIRATESFLHLPASTRVGMFGYSGGSIAGEWAAELAPSYAPELNIVAAAIGGIPVFLAHNLRYVDGSQTWSGVIPAAIVALSRAFGIDLTPYMSAYGRKVTAEVADECIGGFNGNYPGLTVAQMMKPQYADFLAIPPVARIVNSLIMGSTTGHPRMPMLMLVGNNDGTGDDVMVVKDVAALARQYCSQGVSVQYQEVPNADHTNAGITFFVAGQAWLLARMAGLPATPNCGSIPVGNSLAPLPVRAEKRAIHPRLSVRSSGRADVLRVRASAPRGTLVHLYRVVRGQRHLVGTARIGPHGVAVRRVRDRNGSRVTRYVAVVAASRTTMAASDAARHR